MSWSRAPLTLSELAGLARSFLSAANWTASSSLSAQCPAAPEGAGRAVRPWPLAEAGGPKAWELRAA
eukprot:5593223-Prorocentrum_lima.AAC.1